MQVFVKDLSGRSSVLTVGEAESVHDVKARIEQSTGVPFASASLVHQGKALRDGELCLAAVGSGATLRVVGGLLGGKGGFGSMLRASRGLNETTNFDACRDLSGRRVGSIETEKKLEEWKAREEQRRLEKLAQEHMRKMEREERAAREVKVDIQSFQSEIDTTTERVSSAVQSAVRQGALAAASGEKKRGLEAGAGAGTSKRAKGWDLLGQDSDSSDSESDEPAVAAPGKPAYGITAHLPGQQQKAPPSATPSPSTAPAVPTSAPEAPAEASAEAAPSVEGCKTVEDFASLGMAALKELLQAEGLKCGGRLEERAQRMFLLKTRGRQAMDKKHFAKAK